MWVHSFLALLLQLIYKTRNVRSASTCREHGLNSQFFANLKEKTVGNQNNPGNLNFAQAQAASYKTTIDKTLLYNSEHRLTYCWVRKVASSSWNNIFWQFKGKTNVGARKKNTTRATISQFESLKIRQSSFLNNNYRVCRPLDFEALKLWKSRSGGPILPVTRNTLLSSCVHDRTDNFFILWLAFRLIYSRSKLSLS